MTSTPTSTEELWEVLSDKLRAFLLQSVSDADLAEDLLQETFLRIHVSLGELDDEHRLTSWVFQIARNLVVDHWRSRANKTPEEELLEVEAQALDDDENMNAVLRAWLPPMIAQLPDTYRDAVELFELKGLPQQQIADQLGLSLSGAKSRIQRGREKLKSRLFDCCSFERDRRGNVIGYSKNRPGECGSC